MSRETVGIILFVVGEVIASFFLFWLLFIKWDEDFEKWRKNNKD